MRTRVATATATIVNSICVVALLCPSAASTRPSPHVQRSPCLDGDYECSVYGTPTAIPDDDLVGVTIGPIHIPGSGMLLRDVVLNLAISHAFTGDLSFRLHYDSDNDGIHDASSSVEIHLARPDACGDEMWACPIELEGTYFFKDEGWKDAGELASLMVFDGLPSGGSFYLTVTDHAPTASGTVAGWSICVQQASAAPGTATCETECADQCQAGVWQSASR